MIQAGFREAEEVPARKFFGRTLVAARLAFGLSPVPGPMACVVQV
jgi:hypothetical protein